MNILSILGSKYQSNLNEIDKSEHKSSNVDRKGGSFVYEYPAVKSTSSIGNYWRGEGNKQL